MTTKMISLAGLALLLLTSNLYTAAQQKTAPKNSKKTTQKVNPKSSAQAQEAFAVIGLYEAISTQQNPTSSGTKNEQPFPTLQSPIVFKAPSLTERYTKPMKFAYNTKTQKFEPQLFEPKLIDIPSTAIKS